MKNKRNVLIAFILICCLCLSIGYAALTDTLYVDGTADVKVLGTDTDDTDFEQDFREAIYWEPVDTSSNGVTTQTTTEEDSGRTGDNDTATQPDVLTIELDSTVLTYEGASVTVTATVKNDSDYDIIATLSAAQIGNVKNKENEDVAGSTYFTIVNDWSGAQKIAQDDEKDVTFTITLSKAPTFDITDAEFHITLSAVVDEEAENS